jgi:hypothetical protein
MLTVAVFRKSVAQWADERRQLREGGRSECYVAVRRKPVGGSARSGTAAALKARDPEAKLSAAEMFAGEEALP